MSNVDLKNYLDVKELKSIDVGLIVGGTSEYYGASSFIRLLSPFNELNNEYSICIIDHDAVIEFYNDFLKDKIKFKLIIIERDILLDETINLNLIKELFKHCKNLNIPIIFDVDDDLINIDKTHLDYEKYQNIMPLLKFIVLNSELITVPNNILKNQLKKFNEKLKIELIPNILINEWEFNSNNNNNLTTKNTIKLGYFGGTSHKNDLKIIEKSIKNVQNYFKNKKIIFEVIGITDEKLDWAEKIIIPNSYDSNPTLKQQIKKIISSVLQKLNLYNESLPYPSYVKWMKNEIEWDIGVAPLEDNNINKSKSNLKYLEYTALGIPGVYSNIGPYMEIGEKNIGLVVDNNTEEWENAIIKLIEDTKLYKTILTNAKNNIQKHYLVNNSSAKWCSILNKLIK